MKAGESREMPRPVIAVNKQNNFNVLRFLFASLVLLAHAPELTDGNRNREILTQLFGTISFGELAVNGFFLVSGFLIVQSWQYKPNLLRFIRNRVLRIYPAFMVASLLSALVFGPLGSRAHDYFSQLDITVFLKGLILLREPSVPPVFMGQPYAFINSPLWTIKYEFYCYLLVAGLGILGLVKRRNWWLAFTGIIVFLFFISGIANQLPYPAFQLLSKYHKSVFRLFSFFFVGGCFYHFHSYLRYRRVLAAVAAVVLIICLFYWQIAYLGLLTVGAYLLFWFAFTPIFFLAPFKNYADISYGVYLYGWPVQKLWLWYLPELSPWLLFSLSFLCSCVLGWLSWQLVERWFLRLKN